MEFSRIVRFNYLRDASPDLVEQIRAFRVPPQLRFPFVSLFTAVVVVTTWWFLESHWVSEAAREEAIASTRLEQSRQEFTATKLVRSDVDDLLALDARLRRIRLSGSFLSARLADIANHVPHEAWLTSIARTDDGLELQGRAKGLHVLSATVADLMSSSAASSPTLVRAVREERVTPLIHFTIRSEERK